MSDTWSQLESLFHAASELQGEDQERFLLRETEGDPTLREELRDLLRHSSHAGERIGAAVECAAVSAAGGADWAGRIFGPYRIVREVGRGGMGLVFEAWRDDSEYHKRVALKVAPDWRDLDWLRERFRNERQILARLEHPNIARFLDGGTERGIPYFAMEYVEGRPVTAWAREHALGVRDRIALFRQICAPVSYAHENLVIHRDLKPANILVDSTGIPKLLDFGIATLLDAAAAQSVTARGSRLWTPDYASPEQVRGEPMTVRTDIYSLGLLLYELLCGERAQAVEQRSPLAIERAICETDPPPPSVRAAARGERALSRELTGDLDCIVMTAIRKEPARRYNSARALEADLGRYLAGHPISARANTMAYRVAKLVRRNRLAGLAAALVLLAVAGGIGSTLYEARRAERRFQEIRGLANAFIFDVHDRIRFLPGATEARKAIIATALKYLENLRRDAGRDPALLRELASAYKKIGEVKGNPLDSSLGDSRGALESFRNAESILNPLVAKGDPDAKLMLAETLEKMGNLQVQQGRMEGKQQLLRARLLTREIISAGPADIKALGLLIELDSELIRYVYVAPAYDSMLPYAQEAVDTARRMFADFPGRIESQDYLAQANVSLGAAYRGMGELVRAEKSYRSALVARQRVVDLEPNNTTYRRSLLLAYGHLGDILGPPETRGLGRLPDALEAFDKAAAIAGSMVRSDPANRVASFDLAVALFRSAECLLEMPNGNAQGRARLLQSESILSNLSKQDPTSHRYLIYMVSVNALLGKALSAAGQYNDATRRLELVRSLYKSLLGGPNEAAVRSWDAASALRLAQIKARLGDRAAALQLTEEAVAQIPRSDIPKHAWRYALFCRMVGATYKRAGRNSSAVAWFQRSTDGWRKMKVPPALEAHRQKELAGAEHDLAAVRRGRD